MPVQREGGGRGAGGCLLPAGSALHGAWLHGPCNCPCACSSPLPPRVRSSAALPASPPPPPQGLTAEACTTHHSMGGWGPASGDETQCFLPAADNFIANNLVYNPPGWGHSVRRGFLCGAAPHAAVLPAGAGVPACNCSARRRRHRRRCSQPRLQPSTPTPALPLLPPAAAGAPAAGGPVWGAAGLQPARSHCGGP